jgi:hypothetical protein
MEPVMTSRVNFFCAVCLACICTGAANASQFVVVEARGIGWRPGKVIDGSQPLHLLQGQHVTLISETGAILKLDGSYDKPPQSETVADLDVGAVVAGLTTERRARTGDVGTTRAPEKVTLPDPWLLDASSGGNVCLREGSTATFWRPSASTTADFVIMPADRSWKARSQWRAGADRIDIRRDLTVHGSASYFVVLDGAESAITVNTIPAALSNDRMRAAWMAEKGCEAQAVALLGSVR